MKKNVMLFSDLKLIFIVWLLLLAMTRMMCALVCMCEGRDQCLFGSGGMGMPLFFIST